MVREVLAGHDCTADILSLMNLTPVECRVLGVLVEKAQTTPQQYPLTLNALVSGCNQRNNREPITGYTEDDVLPALDRLRGRELAREVMLSGSRVAKFRHLAREALDIGTSELVVLTELLLRGPQTVGELRGRASRMHPLESIEVVGSVLEGLAGRDEPLVERIAPAPGSRAERWRQLLCPDLHPVDVAAPSRSPSPAAPATRDTGDLAGRVERLEREVRELRALLEALGG